MECSLRVNGNVLILYIKDIVFKVGAERKYDIYVGDSVMAYHLYMDGEYICECIDGDHIISCLRSLLYRRYPCRYYLLKKCLEKHVEDIENFCSRMAMLSSRE